MEQRWLPRLLVVICATVILFELKGPADLSRAGKVFYSDDDGKTWFLDDLTKGSPFDHDGKQAYRALVYRCPGGQPFVAFLARFSDSQKAQMQSDSRVIGNAMQEMKKPGESNWVKNSSATESGYPQPDCPDGGHNAVMVLPTDPDSGASR